MDCHHTGGPWCRFGDGGTWRMVHRCPALRQEARRFFRILVELFSPPIVLEWVAARTHWHIEVIRGCDAGRGVAVAHPSDSPADRGCGRRSGWRSCEAGPAQDDTDRQDAAAAYQSPVKLSVADASGSFSNRLDDRLTATWLEALKGETSGDAKQCFAQTF
jgi:hypothetical protein